MHSVDRRFDAVVIGSGAGSMAVKELHVASGAR
jgi:hypothetical protein